MIVTKEQIDTVDSEGNPIKQLILSYVNKEGNISFLKWDIPETEMFEWGYTSKANADKPFQAYDINTKQPIFNEDGTPKMAQWKSYDNKWVKKIPTKRNLSETRQSEILNMFGKAVEPIFAADSPITWYCDIETDVSSEGFPDAESAAMAINTIAITHFPQTIVFGRKPLSEKEINDIQENLRNYSPLTKDYQFEYRYYSTERQMIEAFIDFIIPIPAITGWNFLGYDWKYIYNRCNNLGINILRVSPTASFVDFKLNRKIKIEVKLPAHKIIYDYMQIYQMWDQSVKIKENDSLDFVSEQVLGIKKVEHAWGFEEFYRDHYMEYVFYNSVDTILVECIDKKIKTANIWYMLASELKLELNTAFSTIQPAEITMSNFIYPQYKVIVPKKDKDEENGKYEGAFVWPTQPGVYKYIGGLDFASLYPTTMRQFQISPESFLFKDQVEIGKDADGNPIYRVGDYKPKANEIKTCSGAVYKKDPNAVIPAILTYYFAKRKGAKADRKQCDTDFEFLLKTYEKRMAAGEK